MANPGVVLRRLEARGELERVARGAFALPGTGTSLHASLAEATLASRSAVVCLLSALEFHGFTTQSPHEVWLALATNHTPRAGGLALRVVRMTGDAFTHGVQRHRVLGVTIRVTSPAKTVADCFRFRNKVGLDVATEALREGWRGRRFTMDELWAAARACRVQRVIRPYAEMLAA